MNKQNIINTINLIGEFKDLKRSGWLKKEVILPESDAEHSFSVALLAMLLAPSSIDRLKCIEMALAHDLAEIYAGDITPGDDISPLEKHQKERESIIKISNQLDVPQLIKLFDEFEQKQSKESVFINALDKLDNVITAAYYDSNKRAPSKLTPEFKTYAQKRINDLPEYDFINKIKEILQGID